MLLHKEKTSTTQNIHVYKTNLQKSSKQLFLIQNGPPSKMDTSPTPCIKRQQRDIQTASSI